MISLAVLWSVVTDAQGAPGMPEMLSPGAALVGAGLGPIVPLVTDGRFSGENAVAERRPVRTVGAYFLRMQVQAMVS